MARMSKIDMAAEDGAKEAQVDAPAAREPEAEKAPRAKKLKQWKITFHGKGAPVEIGHNYRMNVYPLNVETVIDENYLDVLRNSTTMTRQQDGAGNWENVSIPTYQYTLGEQV